LGGSDIMKRVAFLAPVMALAGLLALSSVRTQSTSAATPTTWNMSVGQGHGQVAANDFFPEEITVHQGDTIHFASAFGEPHTVTFVPAGMTTPALIVPEAAGPPHLMINPLAANPTSNAGGAVTFDSSQYFNSGLLFKGDSADLTFPKIGTFKFVCLVHAGMSVSVSVVGAGGQVQTQAQLDAAGKADSDQVIANGVAAASQINSTKQQLPDGSYNWRVQAGGHAGEADILEFNSPNITVNAGDTVTWTNLTDTPHTVTFAAPGQALPDFIQPIPQTSGPPILELPLAAVLPAGGSSYDGTAFTNSGIISTADSPTNTFSLKFTKPGTYTYVCLVHGGMMGTITVAGAPASVASSPTPSVPSGVTAPNTGLGPTPGDAGRWLPALLLVALSGLLLVGAGARLRSPRGG
jgi:plastocyanin